MSIPKTGPLTRAELEAVWKSVTDPEYSRAFIETGEGQGFEAHTQAMVQLERVSQGIDQSTQAMYVRPWSGQTNDPASGGAPALVEINVTRSTDFARAVVFRPGTLVEEIATDFGPNGSEEIATGRRYMFLETTAMFPGEAGPRVFIAFADRFGEGHNNPLPDTITRIVQPGSDHSNGNASVVPGASSHALVLDAEPDVITDEQAGQYVEFIAGANQGQVRQILGVTSPDLAATTLTGGTVKLAATQVFRVASITGTFLPAETITQASTGAMSTFLLTNGTYLIAERIDGNIIAGSPVVGVSSGASVTFDSVELSADMLPETGTAQWRIVPWGDFGISVTNPASPEGGRSANLDEIGYERQVYRGTNESDDIYRKRVLGFADLVSPKAILRIANRILVPYGYEATLREVGYPLFRGFFYDGDPSGTDPAFAFAYDLDFATRPAQRFMLGLSYTEMRAFFLLGVPRLGLGEFGFAYDLGGTNAYDVLNPYLNAYDGFPVTAAQIYERLWKAVNEARAAGVGFDLVQELPGSLGGGI